MSKTSEQTVTSSSKVKLLCSYNGKIQPRLSLSTPNHLTYVGGDTKLLTVDRNIKLSEIISKLTSLLNIAPDFSLKYQLPGEDLDALVLVVNDDDVDHMMFEYDRLLEDKTKAARIRLFLFGVRKNHSGSGSGLGLGLNLNPDFLFGFDKVEKEKEEEAIPGYVNNAEYICRVPLKVGGGGGGGGGEGEGGGGYYVYYPGPGGVQNWEQQVYGSVNSNNKLADEEVKGGNQKKG